MPAETRNPAFGRMISDFVRQRGSSTLPPRDMERLRDYLVSRFHLGHFPHLRGGGIDWQGLAEAAGVEPEPLLAAKQVFRRGSKPYAASSRSPHLRPAPQH